jgi:hypothetical protein
MSRNLRQRNSAKVKLKDKFLDIRMLEIRTRRGAGVTTSSSPRSMASPQPYFQPPEKISAFNLSQSAMILRHSAMARAEWSRSGCRFKVSISLNC